MCSKKKVVLPLRGIVDDSVSSNTGIGHTRWATHGVPSQMNAHPHQSNSGRFTIVHNGVIENYSQLKREYLTDVTFKSDTDTEVIVQLIEKIVGEGNTLEEAFRQTLMLLKGSYAIALLDSENDETIYVAKNKSPLLVGLGDDFNVVASDAMAMIQVTDQYVELMDKEMVIVTKEKVEIQNLIGEVMERAPYTAEIDASDIEKGTYPHYMLKEIDEQPLVVRKIIQAYQNENNQLNIDEPIVGAMKDANVSTLLHVERATTLVLLVSNSSRRSAGIPVEVHVASEFSYNMPLLSKKPLFIFISQSGETADSRAVLVQIKELGHKSLTITNVAGSTLSREADYTLLLHAGPEIAVASTKAYTAQLAVLAILAHVAGQACGTNQDFDLIQELGIVATAMEALCDAKEEFEDIAREYLSTTRNCFFIGRSLDFFVGLEGALKLKEISYIQAEGFAGGELNTVQLPLSKKVHPSLLLQHRKK